MTDIYGRTKDKAEMTSLGPGVMQGELETAERLPEGKGTRTVFVGIAASAPAKEAAVGWTTTASPTAEEQGWEGGIDGPSGRTGRGTYIPGVVR
ncbi:hypothetical protein Micbo1qcDRAFT_21554 [Microdochium bolleyi]|uniref:Uncharacterized protein n=1 Tax=Microdochium bolleyi TaxID=196109 RepID=A0A136IS69_9PEZI|nr:hypothetical protein Micbo1qcDRAFT_21554 [Microdochium bolleyi]